VFSIYIYEIASHIKKKNKDNPKHQAYNTRKKNTKNHTLPDNVCFDDVCNRNMWKIRYKPKTIGDRK